MNNYHLVALSHCLAKDYPTDFPYDPPLSYPEFKGKFTSTALGRANDVYNSIRNLLYQLGLDKNNFGTEKWNPFGEFIKPGMKVFIKPNTVVHTHEQNKNIFSVITHASVLRPVLDYLVKALHDTGTIIIGDCQLYSSDFEKSFHVSGIGALLQWYQTKTNVSLEWFDLRMNQAYRTWLYGRWGRKKVEKDPRGYRFVDLQEKSCFHGIDPKKLRIAIASYQKMYVHHCEGKHEYLFPNSFLGCDAVINIAKLKTHRRTGVTLSFKNFMGIPSLKDSLPHFMVGSVQEGGDQYIHPSIRKKVVTFLHDQIQTIPSVPVKCMCAILKKLLWNTHRIIRFKDDIYEGMWPGNDTLWRTLSDLNRIIMYADKNGTISTNQQRTIFNIIDGVIGGENDGPLTPDPVHAGILLAGFNQVAVDAVATTLMGFDISKVPLIQKTAKQNVPPLNLFSGDLQMIQLIDEEKSISFDSIKNTLNLHFKPHPQWQEICSSSIS